MPNTTNFAWNMPTEFADSDTWGGELNALFQNMDDAISSLATDRNYATAGGTADVLTLTTNTPLAAPALVDGMEFRFKASGTNTTGMTLNPDGIGATAIKYADGSAIPAGGVVSGQIYAVTYNSSASAFILAGSSASPASAAETLTGTDIAKFLTAAGLAGNKSLGANGYYKFPGGFTVQWGATSTSITTESDHAVTFPVAFATACGAAIATPNNPTGSSGNDGTCQLKNMSTTGATFRMQDVGGTLSGVTWIAVGY